jgi:hypothetical protein
MAKLVFGMNQSLDGYVDHMAFGPGPRLFRHFIEQVRGLTGSVYGRRLYEVMRYWDEDHPEWSAEECEFAAAPTEVGRVAHAEIRRSQRHPCRG